MIADADLLEALDLHWQRQKFLERLAEANEQSRRNYDALVHRLDHPQEPTPALVKLMRNVYNPWEEMNSK